MHRLILSIALVFLWSAAAVQAEHLPPPQCAAQRQAVEKSLDQTDARRQPKIPPNASASEQEGILDRWRAQRDVEFQEARQALQACLKSHGSGG